MNYEDFIRL